MVLSRLMRLGAAVFFLAAVERASLFGKDSAGATKANLDLPFDAGGEDDLEEEEAPEVIVFYGQMYEGDGIVFCCDTSASMSEGGKFERLQREVTTTIFQFSDRVQFGIVFFNTGIAKFPASGGPADSTPAMKEAATQMVMAATSTGNGSCYKRGLIEALRMVNQADRKRKIIVCLGDALLSCGGQDWTRYGEETLREVRSQNVQAVRVNTICIGPQGQANEAWMRQLAGENRGTYARVNE